MDRREAHRYLNRLYEPGDSIEVLYLNAEGQVARKTVKLDGIEDVEQLLNEFERAEAAEFNVYASAMPLGTQKTGKYDRIWIDQDDLEGPWPFGADPKMGDKPNYPAPTTLVKTSEGIGGFRWQAIWLLSERLNGDEARSAMKRLAAAIGADGSVHDPRRVLRVPGIMNVKRGSAARLMESNDGTIDFAAFNLPTETALTALLTAEVQNPNHVLGEFMAGAEEGDRNRKAYMAARHLRAAAVSYNDAAAFLMLGASRCNPPLDERELEHAMNSAYHRGAQ